jgi:hypothetical protein
MKKTPEELYREGQTGGRCTARDADMVCWEAFGYFHLNTAG